jgi:hypothetical protein
MLDGNPHQLGQRAHAKLGLELGASIGNFHATVTALSYRFFAPGI